MSCYGQAQDFSYWVACVANSYIVSVSGQTHGCNQNWLASLKATCSDGSAQGTFGNDGPNPFAIASSKGFDSVGVFNGNLINDIFLYYQGLSMSRAGGDFSGLNQKFLTCPPGTLLSAIMFSVSWPWRDSLQIRCDAIIPTAASTPMPTVAATAKPSTGAPRAIVTTAASTAMPTAGSNIPTMQHTSSTTRPSQASVTTMPISSTASPYANTASSDGSPHPIPRTASI